MTVIVSKPAINLREELADLRNQGTYQEQQFYFDGLVTNGDFATNDLTGWVDNSTGTAVPDASTGVAVLERIDGSNVSIITQSVPTVAGARYLMVGTVSGGTMYVLAGTVSGGTDLLNSSSSGSFSFNFVASGATTYITFRSASDSSAFSVDDVSIYETDANDDAIHTMPKGWKPKDVFEDGLLQREGAAHDYEVVYDGFDYFVKPTVAPSATTQTCVIGVKA